MSGLDAPVSSDGKGNPAPLLIRIKDLAVLPNAVRGNLQGCFIVAEGLGNLGTERAELRLISLSCISRDGTAVIDQKIKGFTVDSDGKLGLRGRVVSKLGSTISRAMLAGLFGGAGDAIKQSATSTSINPLGSTQTIDPKNLGLAAAGGSLSSGFKQIQDFYMSLAKMSMPVIEIGALKKINIVFSEGTWLEIKKGYKDIRAGNK